MNEKIIENIDYTGTDKKVDKLINEVCLYMVGFSRNYIENEIKKAYLFAREAHH